jgi:hypothetical protein
VYNKNRFINKSGTNEVLLQLVKENYLTKINKHQYTIYQGNLSMIYEEIKKLKNINIVKEILNITEDTYMTSAIFYNVNIFVCINQDCNF